MNGEAIYDKTDAIHHVERLMSAHRGKLTLAVLPLYGMRYKPDPLSPGSRQNGKGYRDAKALYSKVLH